VSSHVAGKTPAGSIVGTPLLIENTGATAADHATLELKVSGGSGGDCRVLFTGTGQDWYGGVDNTDNGFKVGLGSTVGTDVIFRVDTSGHFYATGVVHGTSFFSVATGTEGVSFPGSNSTGLLAGNAVAVRANPDASIADGDTALLIRRNVGGAFTQQQVSMGAADSGGAGFKVLRVAN